MVIFVKPSGETVIENSVVGLGSHVGKIAIVSPSRPGAYVALHVAPASGEYLPPIYCAPMASINADDLGIYLCDITRSITSVAGRVRYQVSFSYENEREEFTPEGSFMVSYGVVSVPPDDPSDTMYNAIRSALIANANNYTEIIERLDIVWNSAKLVEANLDAINESRVAAENAAQHAKKISDDIDEVVSDSLTEAKESGKFDGVSVTHEWDGSVLRVTSASGTSESDLRGPEGKRGETGKGFEISKTYASVLQMHADYGNPAVPLYGFVLIDTGNVEDEDNAKLFVKQEDGYQFLIDLSGSEGIKGERGYSAYDTAVQLGFIGSEDEWIASLKKPAEDAAKNVVDIANDAAKNALEQAKESGEFDGKSAYAYAQDGGYTGTEEEFAAKMVGEYNPNPLYGKKVSFLGDSICAGADTEVSYLGGYGKIIADRNNMVYENLGKGGATITAETYSSSNGSAKGWLCRMVDNMSADADYAIVEGGVNDAWQWSDHGTIEIGKISDGYNATLDDTTYYGAFESMLKKLITKFQGKKIGYIAIPKTMELFDSSRNVPNFYHIALECCAKWGVPVCDLNTIVPPSACLGTAYVPDGTHPNYEGYLKYYCDPIEAWMKTLTTGGNNSAMIARKAVEEYTKGFNDAIEALQKGKLNNTGVAFKRAKLPLADGTTIEIDVLTAVDGTLVIPFTNRVPISIDTDGSVFNGVGYQTGYRLNSSGATKEQNYSAVTGFIPAKAGDVIRITGCGWHHETALNYVCAYKSDHSFIGGVTSNLTKYGTTIYSNISLDGTTATVSLANVSDIAYIRVSSINDGNCEYCVSMALGADMIITVNEEITA